MQSLYTEKFQAADLLKLEALFTYKTNCSHFDSFGMREAILNRSTTCKVADLEEFKSISYLMPPYMV